MPPLLRIPYTDPLPLPKIIPSSAVTVEGAVAALVDFLSAGHAGVRARRPRASDVESERHVREQHRQEESWRRSAGGQSHRAATGIGSGSGSGEGTAGARGADVRAWGKTLLLTGAGISVASGLADYRGTNGTYTLNKTYKPIYYNEFCASHEARKRYWARSFLGWTTLHQAKANDAHRACGRLAELGIVDNLITQNVDSFHPLTHPHLPTIELHGYLRSLSQLSMLNPAWAAFLTTLLTTGALNTEDPHSRRKLGLKANPDGDIDVPNAPYTTFRYPACPVCLAKTSSTAPTVSTDADGAWTPPSTTGILKPA
ncbi:DHS-like NAD/FAD-binding domain-containing protein, partial [Amniculicola lignicola CBS 123094]